MAKPQAYLTPWPSARISSATKVLMAIPCPPEVLFPREAFWISLVNRRNQRFLLFDGAAARESRDIIKNPRSPRGKNDIVHRPCSLSRSNGSRPQIIRVSRVESRGRAGKGAGWKGKEKNNSHGTTRNPPRRGFECRENRDRVPL